MDDDTGWDEILVQGWGPLVRGAVVERVEAAMVGRRGVLLRALTEETASAGQAACVEEVHDRVLDAIRAETGADLDHLGSQAAWACYDEVWGALQQRWTAGGGGLVAVPIAHADEVAMLVRSLPAAGAQHAGADIGSLPWQLLRVGGRAVIDVQGLFAWVARDRGEMDPGARVLVDRLVSLVRGRAI